MTDEKFKAVHKFLNSTVDMNKYILAKYTLPVEVNNLLTDNQERLLQLLIEVFEEQTKESISVFRRLFK